MRTLPAPPWGRWVAAAVILVLAVAAGTAYVVSSHPSRRRAPAVVTAPPRPLPMKPLAASAPQPTTAGVAAALAAALRDPAFGGHITGEVVDGITGQPLFDRDAATAMPPASTVKVLTATAALSTLGPTATLTTGVVRDGSTLYLIGGGDVTLSAATGLPSLATQTAAALGAARPPVHLCVDTSAWPTGPAAAPGWNPGYFTAGDIAHLSPLEVDEGSATAKHSGRAPIPRVADPVAQAAALFTAALHRVGVKVVGTACRRAAPASALGVAEVHSAPLSQLVARMLTVSDNDLAEALGRTIARQRGQPATFAGAAAAVLAAVHAAGIDVTGIKLYDASGLSHLDRVPPHTLVQALELATSTARAPRFLLDGLPVAGLTGTLSTRYRRGPASAGAGVVRAKTGTLAGVNTIAGYLVDTDGRLLVFAFMTDRATGPDATEAALDRLVARLAGCGCR